MSTLGPQVILLADGELWPCFAAQYEIPEDKPWEWARAEWLPAYALPEVAIIEFFRHHNRAFQLLVDWLRGLQSIPTGVPFVEPLPAGTPVTVTYHGDLELTLVSEEELMVASQGRREHGIECVLQKVRKVQLASPGLALRPFAALPV